MNRRGRPAIVLRGATALAIAGTVTGFAQPPAFATQQVSLAVMYTCDFPVIGNQSASVDVDSDIPNSIAVGQSTAHYVVNASATAPWELTLGLHAYGVSTITGTVDGQATVEAPQGDRAETMPFTIQQIAVPGFGSFTGAATGSAPELTFTKPGRAEIVLGDLTMHLVPRDSNGNLTSLGLMSVPCTLNPGQSDVAISLDITAAASSTSSSPSPSPSLNPSPSASPSASATMGVSIATPTATPSRIASLTEPKPSKGDDAAWEFWLGGLVALAGTSVGLFRYGPRLWNR